MREIIFRGKTEISERWVVGDLLQFSIGDMCICESRDDFKKDKYGVIPETVGQYTGLTDKNGKRIFEGDIVLQPVRETRKHSPCIIEFRKGAFMAHYKSENRFFDRYYDINSFTKVIGNITDNPELLKGE